MVWYFFEIDHIHAFRFFSAASRDLVETVSSGIQGECCVYPSLGPPYIRGLRGGYTPPRLPTETAGEVSATQLQSYEAMKSNCRVMADYSRYQNPDL